MVDLIKARQELELRRSRLRNIKAPVITARMRHGGIKTRPQRQEIRRYKREIARQKHSYTEQIAKIDEHIKDNLLEPPRISLFKHPKLIETRMIKRTKLKRKGWF